MGIAKCKGWRSVQRLWPFSQICTSRSPRYARSSVLGLPQVPRSHHSLKPQVKLLAPDSSECRSGPGFLSYSTDAPRLGVKRTASIDHQIHYHDLRAWDGASWLLFQTDSAHAGGGRAHVIGRLWDARTRTLVASVAQEVLLELEPHSKLRRARL